MPSPTKENYTKCIVCPGPVFSERKDNPNLTLNQSYRHNDMIGKAEVFLGTDNYIITNKRTETNKQKHFTRKNNNNPCKQT